MIFYLAHRYSCILYVTYILTFSLVPFLTHYRALPLHILFLLITRVPSQDRLFLIGRYFVDGLLSHPLQNALSLLPAPSPTFTELSRKSSCLQAPAIRTGHIKVKATAAGLGVWLPQGLTVASLAAAFGACFLRLQKATLGSTTVPKSHLWKLACCLWMKGKVHVVSTAPQRELNQNQTQIIRYPSPAAPLGTTQGLAAGGCSPF